MLVNLLLMKIKFFQSHKQSIWGPTYRRTWGTVARFIGVKTKHCSQLLGVSSQIKGSALSQPLGAEAHMLAFQAQESQDPDMQNISVSFPSVHHHKAARWLLGPDGCYRESVREATNHPRQNSNYLLPLLSVMLTTWVCDQVNSLSNQPISFLVLHRLVPGVFPNQSFFWILWWGVV